VFRERFLREARASARLEHDNVVPVYQVDEDRGVVFLAMPLLRGETLDDRLLREPKPPMTEVLRIGREIADGLDAAHSHGLIHRDVKPSNVWLESGRGRVKILDFGLARVADQNQNQLTQEGLVMGTPAFMAPEQARGLPVDGRCDLFSLGCILYRMSTGRNPFQGENPFSLMVAVTTAEPPAPTDLDPSIPAALAELIMQLLAKEPAARPASARDVVERIAAIEQADQATQALPVVPPKPARRLWPVAVLVLAAVLLGMGAVAAWRYGPRWAVMLASRPSPTEAPTPADEHVGTLVIEAEDPQLAVIVLQNGAVVVPATKRRQLELKPGGYDVELAGGGRGAVLEPAHFEVKEGDFATVRIKAAAAAEKPGDALTGLALAGRPASIPGAQSWTLETRGHRGPVHDAQCRPNGAELATAGADGAVRLWDLESGKLLSILLAHEHPLRAVAWSPDGKMLAAQSVVGMVDIWDPETGRLLQTIRAGPSRALAWSPDGARLATGGDKKINLWETQTGKLVSALDGQTGEARALAWSPDGKTVAAVAADKLVRLWDPDKGKESRTLPADSATEPVALAWSADGKLLAVGRVNLTAQIWDIGASDKLLQTIPALGAADKEHPVPIGLAWMAKGRKVAVIGAGTVQVWGAPFEKGGRTFDARGTTVCWSADGRRLVSADEATGAHVWDVSAAGRTPLVTTLPVYKMERVLAERWSPDGKLAALQGTQTVWLFSTAGRLVQTLHGPTREITALAWSPDGKRIAAAGGWDRQVYIWGAADGKLAKTYTAPHPDCEVTALAWSPDNRTLALGLDRPVEAPLWSVDDGKTTTVLKGQHSDAINALLWVDAKTVVSGSADDTGAFWNAETGSHLRTIRPGGLGASQPITALALSPNGQTIAAGLGRAPNHAARLFDVSSERAILDLRGPGVVVGQLTWLADGKTLAGRSEDGVLRFWDAATGGVTRIMPPRPGQEYLLPDHGFGASASGAFSVRFWDLDDFRAETSVVLLERDGAVQWLAVAGDGHYAASKDLDSDLVYVVRADAGMRTLAPKDFAAAYGWRNDPDRVGLPAAK
ncbi:MAG TPA: protein kinase, partial [Gemmataceae bacterium]|nr:protein kinase [Gemmataceae bacterium]